MDLERRSALTSESLYLEAKRMVVTAMSKSGRENLTPMRGI